MHTTTLTNGVRVKIIDAAEDPRYKNDRYWVEFYRKEDGEIERAPGWFSSVQDARWALELLLLYGVAHGGFVGCITHVFIKDQRA